MVLCFQRAGCWFSTFTSTGTMANVPKGGDIDVVELAGALAASADPVCVGIAAFAAGPRAQHLLHVLKNAACDAPEFREAYTQCVSREFLAMHPPSNLRAGTTCPQFQVCMAGVEAARSKGSLPPHLLGHAMLRHDAATLPTYIAGVIKGTESMHGLLDHVDIVAATFAMHGALLAALNPPQLERALSKLALGSKLDNDLKALANLLLGKAHSRRRSAQEVWDPLVDAIRDCLPRQLPGDTPMPNKITASSLDTVLRIEESKAAAVPTQLLKHVEVASASAVDSTDGPYYWFWESDDEEQQNHGVAWLVTSAMASRVPTGAKFSFHGKALNMLAIRRDDRRVGDRAALKLIQDLLHPYSKNSQIKPDFVRWLRCPFDKRVRLPTMVGESKPEHIDTDGRAKFQLAAYLMYLVRIFRLVDPDPTALGRLWHGTHVQYYSMTLGSSDAGSVCYVLAPWGAEFDMTTEAGRVGAVRRERACIAYCRSIEAKLHPVMSFLVAQQ